MTSHSAFPISLDIRLGNAKDIANVPVLLDVLLGQGIDFDFEQCASDTVRLYGSSELDLEVVVHGLIQELPVLPQIRAPTVRYREVLERECEVEYSHKKLRVGVPEFAVVRLKLVRTDPDMPLSFASIYPANLVSREIFDAVERGVTSVAESGPIADMPIFGARAVLVEAKAMEGVSKPIHFEIAARAGMREGLSMVCALYEPIAKLDVLIADEFVGSVVGNLLSRRGVILGDRIDAGRVVIQAEVPIANTFGYISTLRSKTSGMGTFRQFFSHYALVPFGRDDPDDFRPAMALRG